MYVFSMEKMESGMTFVQGYSTPRLAYIFARAQPTILHTAKDTTTEP